MKRIFVSLFACLILCGATLPCYAESMINSPSVTYTETITDNITCVTTIYWDDAITRASYRQGHISKDYYHNGDRIASIVLNATFTYNGTTATATSASGDHSLASGWSYSGESTWCSGATAHLTATVSGPVSVPVSLSLTCSPSGALS